MKNKKVVVVGAGAAGLMAASTAAAYGAGVTLIEKNRRVGRKIMITGKGRCNVCNNCDVETFIRNVPVNGKFLYSAINKLTPEDTIAFFEGLGLALKTERGNRVFPQSDRAVDVVDTLYNYAKNCGCKIVEDTAEELLLENGERCVRLPMIGDARSLNLSNTVAVAVYEVLRQWDYPELENFGNLHNYSWD